MRILLAAVILAAAAQTSWKRFEFRGLSVEAPAGYVSAIDHDGNRLKVGMPNGGGGAIMLERDPEVFADAKACLADLKGIASEKPCRIAGQRASCMTKGEPGSEIRFAYFCAGATEWKLVVSFDTAAEMDHVVASVQVKKP